jgi:hypothetical protein
MAGEAETTALIEGFVETTNARYMGYRFAMLGALNQSLTRVQTRPRAPADDELLIKTIRQIVAMGADTEAMVIESATVKMIEADPEVDRVSELGEVRRTVAMITEQLRRDARKILRYFRSVLLASVPYRSAGFTQEQALKAAQIERQGELTFTYPDSAGRQWTAERYLEVVVRSHFYQVLNRARLERMQEDGIASASVHNPQGSNHGVEVDTSSSGRFRVMLNRIFHPNSKAILSPPEK